MSADAPKPVSADEATLTMARRDTAQADVAPRVIPAAPTGQAGELIELAANTTDHDDVHDTRAEPTVHRAPHPKHRLPQPEKLRAAGGAPAELVDQVASEGTLLDSAALLGVDPSEMPRLLATLRASLVSRNASLDMLVAEADKLGLDPAQSLAILIATSLPERFASVAEFAPTPPHGQAQVTLSMYVAALLADELARTMPEVEALRLSAIASGRLTRLRPEEMVLVGFSIPLLVDAMGRAGRRESSTAIAALVHAVPDELARVTRENRETRLLLEARAMAQSTHDPDDADTRGLAVAAAFVLLANSPTPEAARALYERANRDIGVAAPRIILSCADSDDRGEALTDRLTETLDRLVPFLDKYDQLRAQMVPVSTVPRAELCNMLHAQLTRGSEQFYIALLSLLRRHSAFCTRPGARALRTALRDRTTWDDLEVA